MSRPADAKQRLLLESAHLLAIGRVHSAKEALRSAGQACGMADRREWPDPSEVEALAGRLGQSAADSEARRQAWAADALAAMEFLQPRRIKAEVMPLYQSFGEQPQLVLWLFEDSVETLILELAERGLPARLVRRRLYPGCKADQAPLQIDCVAFLAGERAVTLVALPESLRANRYSWEAGASPVELLNETALRQIASAAHETTE